MSRNLVKFYNATEQEDHKVIDSNALMEKKMSEILAESARRAAARKESASDGEMYDMDESAGFVEGIDAQMMEALVSDSDESGNVIKAIDPNEEAEAIRAEAKAKADEIVATAEQLAQEYKNNSRREAEIEGTRIKADAKQEGFQQGLVQAQSEYEAKMVELQQMEMAMNAEYEQMCQSLEARFIDTITGIYEHIFKVDLAEYQPLLAQLVADTIRGVETSKTYIIHVSSEDYPTVGKEQKDALESAAPGCNVEVVEDIALVRNQCLLETDSGVFDCGLDTQLRELRRKLMLLSYTPDLEV